MSTLIELDKLVFLRIIGWLQAITKLVICQQFRRIYFTVKIFIENQSLIKV
jgi:hypothetical protein